MHMKHGNKGVKESEVQRKNGLAITESCVALLPSPVPRFSPHFQLFSNLKTSAFICMGKSLTLTRDRTHVHHVEKGGVFLHALFLSRLTHEVLTPAT